MYFSSNQGNRSFKMIHIFLCEIKPFTPPLTSKRWDAFDLSPLLQADVLQCGSCMPACMQAK